MVYRKVRILFKKAPIYDAMLSVASGLSSIDEKLEITQKMKSAAAIASEKAGEIDAAYSIHQKIESVPPLNGAINFMQTLLSDAIGTAGQIYKETAEIIEESHRTDEPLPMEELNK